MSAANKRSLGDTVGAPAASKRGRAEQPAAPSVSALQRELQLEQERRGRLEESVEQLRLELQLMGRLLAAAREQLVACGASPPPAGATLRTPPARPVSGQRPTRSKSDAKLLQRLQDELEESNGLCRRLAQQAEGQQQKLAHAGSAKRELLAVAAEMHEWLTRS